MGQESRCYEEFTYSGDKLVKITGTPNSYRDSLVFKYDVNGLLMIKEVYYHDGHREKYIYNYDSLGRNTERYYLTDLTSQKKDSANVIRKNNYYYSNNSLLPDSIITRGVQYQEGNMGKITYRYYTSGLKEEEEHYCWHTDSVCRKKIFIYNRNWDLAYDVLTNHEYDYEYDTAGNWTKRTEKGNKIYSTRRKLKYY